MMKNEFRRIALAQGLLRPTPNPPPSDAPGDAGPARPGEDDKPVMADQQNLMA